MICGLVIWMRYLKERMKLHLWAFRLMKERNIFWI